MQPDRRKPASTVPLPFFVERCVKREPVTEAARSKSALNASLRAGTFAEPFLGSDLQSNDGLVRSLLANSDAAQSLSDIARRRLDQLAIEKKQQLDDATAELRRRQRRAATPGFGASRSKDKAATAPRSVSALMTSVVPPLSEQHDSTLRVAGDETSPQRSGSRPHHTPRRSNLRGVVAISEARSLINVSALANYTDDATSHSRRSTRSPTTVSPTTTDPIPLPLRQSVVSQLQEGIDSAAVSRAQHRRDRVHEKRRAVADLVARFSLDAPPWMLPPPDFAPDSDDENDYEAIENRTRLSRDGDEDDDGADTDEDARNKAYLENLLAARGMGTSLQHQTGNEVVGGDAQRSAVQRTFERRAQSRERLDAPIRPRRLPATSQYMHMISLHRQQHDATRPAVLPTTVTARQRLILRETLGLHSAPSATGEGTGQLLPNHASDPRVISSAARRRGTLAPMGVETHAEDADNPFLLSTATLSRSSVGLIPVSNANTMGTSASALSSSSVLADAVTVAGDTANVSIPLVGRPPSGALKSSSELNAAWGSRRTSDVEAAFATRSRRSTSAAGASKAKLPSTDNIHDSSSTCSSSDDSIRSDLAKDAAGRRGTLRRLPRSRQGSASAPGSTPTGADAGSGRQLTRRATLAQLLQHRNERRRSSSSAESPGQLAASGTASPTASPHGSPPPKRLMLPTAGTAIVGMVLDAAARDSGAPSASSVAPPPVHVKASAPLAPDIASEADRGARRSGGFALPAKFIRYASNTASRSLLEGSTARAAASPPDRVGANATDHRGVHTKRHAEHAIHIELVFAPGCLCYVSDDDVALLTAPFSAAVAGLHRSDRGGRFISILCDEQLQGLKAATRLLGRVHRGEWPSIAEAYIAPACGVPDGFIQESPRVADIVADEELPIEEITWDVPAASESSLGGASGAKSAPSTDRDGARKRQGRPSARISTLRLSLDGDDDLRRPQDFTNPLMAAATPQSSLNATTTPTTTNASASASGTSGGVATGSTPSSESPAARRQRMLAALANAAAGTAAVDGLLSSPGAASISSPQEGSSLSLGAGTHMSGVTPKAWGASVSMTPQTLSLPSGANSKAVTPNAAARMRQVTIASPIAAAMMKRGATKKTKPRRRRGDPNDSLDDEPADDAEADERAMLERRKEEDLLAEFDEFVHDVLSRSNRVAIIIALTHFEDPTLLPISYAQKDADDFCSLLHECGYECVVMKPHASRWFLVPTVVNVINVVQGFLRANGSGGRSSGAGGGLATAGHPVTAIFLTSRGYIGAVPNIDTECEVAMAYDSDLAQLNPNSVLMPARLATMIDATGKHPFVFADIAPINHNPHVAAVNASGTGKASGSSSIARGPSSSGDGQTSATVIGGHGFSWLTSHVEEGGNEMLVTYPRHVSGLASYYLKRALEGRAISGQSLHLSVNAILWYLNGKLQNRNCRVQHNAIVARPHSVFFSMFVLPAAKYGNHHGLLAALRDRDAAEFTTRVRINARLRCRIAEDIGGEEPRYSLRNDSHMWVRHITRHIHGCIYPKEKKIKMFDRRAQKVQKHVEHADRARIACARLSSALLGIEYRDLIDIVSDSKRRANFEKDFSKLATLCTQHAAGRLPNFFGDTTAGGGKDGGAASTFRVGGRLKSIATMVGAASSVAKRRQSLAAVATLALHSRRRSSAAGGGGAQQQQQQRRASRSGSIAANSDENAGDEAETSGGARSDEHDADAGGSSLTPSTQALSIIGEASTIFGAGSASLIAPAVEGPPLSVAFTLSHGVITVRVNGKLPRSTAQFIVRYLQAAAAKKTPKGAQPVVMFRKAQRLHYVAEVSFAGSKRDLRKLDRLQRQQAIVQYAVIESLAEDPFDPSDHAIVERVQAAYRGYLVRRVIREQSAVRDEESADREGIRSYEHQSGKTLFDFIYRRRVELCIEEENGKRIGVRAAEHDERRTLVNRALRFVQQQEARLRSLLQMRRDVEFMPLRERGIRLAIMAMAHRYLRASFSLHWFVTGVFWDRYYLELSSYQQLLTMRSDFRHQHRDADLRIGKVDLAPEPPSSFEGGHSVIRALLQQQKQSGGQHASMPMMLPDDSVMGFALSSESSQVLADSVVIHFGSALD